MRIYRADVRRSGREVRVYDPASGAGGLFRVLPARTDIAHRSGIGLGWGYGGAAPAQLAVALLADHLGGLCWCERCGLISIHATAVRSVWRAGPIALCPVCERPPRPMADVVLRCERAILDRVVAKLPPGRWSLSGEALETELARLGYAQAETGEAA